MEIINSKIVGIKPMKECVVYALQTDKGYMELACPREFNNSEACRLCTNQIKQNQHCRGGISTGFNVPEVKKVRGGYFLK